MDRANAPLLKRLDGFRQINSRNFGLGQPAGIKQNRSEEVLAKFTNYRDVFVFRQ